MITVNNLKMRLGASENDIKEKISQKLGTQILYIKILKRAVDARKKDDVHFVFNIEAKIAGDENKIVKKCNDKDIFISKTEKYTPPSPCTVHSRKKTVVVGSGPAGLFSAYILAMAGMEPVLIERGKCVEERIKDVELFRNTGILNTESNIQFGEGGAGTFSDGKLNTGIKDVRIRYVLETFAEAAEGEADDILYSAKPHIGTDRLIGIIRNMRKKITDMGGTVLFEHKLCGIISDNGTLRGIMTEHGGITTVSDCDTLVLAIGHSARDTVKMLYDSNVHMEQKPYAMGVRIEHKREVIDKSRYGAFAGHKDLGAADYKISCTPDGKRGVYSFCMCPGGEVVPAASEEGMLAVNGMSRFARDAENSNSALLVGVSPDDLKSANPLAGIELQRKTERLAFELGGGGYKAPVQLAGDLIAGRASQDLGSIKPSYKPGVTPSDLRECLPGFIIESIRASLEIFGRTIEGFDAYDAVLTGVESRSSSPVRIKRDSITLEAGIKGIYPCGEGAGYAGGIVSAAVDGIKCAEKIIMKAKYAEQQ